MKILKLSIKNLNSLMGEYTIDFSKSPLSDTGLFAITGETGAGKSTILDAISLAIYNSIPRGSSEDDIMSHGAWEAMAEVEFESGNKKYRSTWQRTRARKKPDGNLQSSSLRLADITDPNPDKHKTIAEKKKDIEKEIKEITGLDVDKFKQSVLLAQGEFAAFMKADPGKRGELLEKITQQTDYSKYSVAAYNKYKEEKIKLEELLTNIENFKTLSVEEKKEIQQHIEVEKTEVSKLETLRDEIQKSILWLETISDKEKEKQQAENYFYIAEENLKNAEDIKKRKEAHEQTIPFHPDLALLDESEANLKLLNEQISSIEKSLPTIKENKEKEKEIFSITEQQFAILKKEIEEQEPLFTLAATLDEGIKNANEKYLKLLNDEKLVLKKIEELSEQIKNKKILSDDYALKIAEKDKWLNRFSHYKNIPEIKAQVAEKLNIYNNLYNEKTLKEKNIDELKIQLKGTEAKNNTVKKNLPKFQSEKNSLKTAIENSLNTKAELLAGSDFQNIKKEVETIEIRKNAFENLLRISQDWKSKTISKEEHLTKHTEQIHLAEKLNITKVETEQKIKTLEEYLNTLEQKRDYEILIKNYEEDRKKLQEGMPCFLCGSTNHPYIENKKTISLSETEKTIKEKKNELKNLNKTLNETTENIPSKAALEQIYKIVEADEKEIKKLENDFNNLKKETKISDIRINEIEELEKQLHANKIDAEKQKKRINQIEIIIEQISNSESDLKKITEQLHSYDLNFQESELKLQELIEKSNNAGIDLEQTSKQLEEIKTAITKLLQPYNIIFNEKASEKAIESLIKQENEYQKSAEEKIELGEKNNILQTEIAADKKTQENLKNENHALLLKEIDETKTNLNAINEERKQIFNNRKINDVKKEYKEKSAALNETLLNQQKKVKEYEENLTQAETIIITTNRQKEQQELFIIATKNKLQEKMQNIFQSVEEIKERIIEKAEFEKIKKQYDELVTQHTNAKIRLETISKQLTEEKEKKITEEPKENLELKLNEIKAKADEAKERISNLFQKLKQDEEIRKKHSAELVRIEGQQKELERWELLNKVIGSADGDEFRKYAQSITMRQLTEIANKHLERISGRYNVVMLKNKKRIKNLELDIIDRYQGNNIRPMDTLSGGETFLVSLALALGLSDMASSKNPVESLFIDEGFGSLDPATLDMALSALENLQSSGKTIGIISHVGLLKERIPCQVQVIKKGSGNSEIKIV